MNNIKISLSENENENCKSFENLFAHIWPGDRPHAAIPTYIQSTFSQLNYGTESVILSWIPILRKGPFDETPHTNYLVISNFYIMLWSDDAFDRTFAIRTKDIKRVSLFNAILGNVIEIEKFYEDNADMIDVSFLPKKVLSTISTMIDNINHTISIVREKISFMPEAPTLKQHYEEMKTLSPEETRKIFQKKCWTPDNWSKKGSKYVDAVIKSACLELVVERDIIAFFDDTIFQNGKSGLAIVTDSLISKHFEYTGKDFQKETRIFYKQISNALPDEDHKNEELLLELDDGRRFRCASADLTEAGCKRMCQFLKYMHLILS